MAKAASLMPAILPARLATGIINDIARLLLIGVGFATAETAECYGTGIVF